MTLLERIGLDGRGWCELVARFGKLFMRATGTADSLEAEATRRRQDYLQAPARALFVANS